MKKAGSKENPMPLLPPKSNDNSINYRSWKFYQTVSIEVLIELKEITWALGAEYVFREQFMLRSGYFHESEEKGFRKFFSIGAGFKYNAVQIDLSYLFSTAQVRNPLENTLRFSLSFNLGDEYYND